MTEHWITKHKKIRKNSILSFLIFWKEGFQIDPDLHPARMLDPDPQVFSIKTETS
jgi:hypothetical protein